MNQKPEILTTRIIESETQLHLIEGEWNKLHAAANGTVFQTFEWTQAWWQLYAQNNFSLFTLTLWNKDCLVGILPLYYEVIYIPFKFKRLRFI